MARIDWGKMESEIFTILLRNNAGNITERFDLKEEIIKIVKLEILPKLVNK